MSGHGDDRNMASRTFFQFADRIRGLEPVHVRHLHVHQDHVEGIGGPRLDCFAAVAGDCHLMTLASQHPDGQFLIGQIVFGQQNLKWTNLGVRVSRFGFVSRGMHHVDTQRRHDGVEDFGLFERLHQASGDSQLIPSFAISFPSTRSEHDDEQRI